MLRFQILSPVTWPQSNIGSKNGIIKVSVKIFVGIIHLSFEGNYFIQREDGQEELPGLAGLGIFVLVVWGGRCCLVWGFWVLFCFVLLGFFFSAASGMRMSGIINSVYCSAG